MPTDDTTYTDEIASVAVSPAEVNIDGQQVKQQDISDLIEADKYLSAKAATRRTGLGIKFVNLKPPSAL